MFLSAGSSCDKLLLVIDLGVELVVISDQGGALERQRRFDEHRIVALDLGSQLVPLLVEDSARLSILFDAVGLFVCIAHLQRFVERNRVDFLKDGLKSNQRFLQYLVPVVLRQINDDGHEHGERLLLVSLKNVKEVVVLEEAHGSVSDLQVDTANALDDSLEEARYQGFDLVHFADFEHLLQLSQEKCLLNTVGEGPVLEKTFEERDGQRAVLGQEEHGAAEELLVELRAGLHLVKRNDNRLEEDNVLISKWDRETRYDTRQDIEKLGGSIELVVLMN